MRKDIGKLAKVKIEGVDEVGTVLGYNSWSGEFRLEFTDDIHDGTYSYKDVEIIEPNPLRAAIITDNEYLETGTLGKVKRDPVNRDTYVFFTGDKSLWLMRYEFRYLDEVEPKIKLIL